MRVRDVWQGQIVEPTLEQPTAILVVDDDHRVATVLKQLLERVGCPVVTVHSATEALRLTGTFVVGVFDIDLGDGCGVDLAEQLMASGRVQRAVFFTGGASSDRLVRARSLGDCLLKGADTLRLESHVRRLLRAQPTCGSAGEE